MGRFDKLAGQKIAVIGGTSGYVPDLQLQSHDTITNLSPW